MSTCTDCKIDKPPTDFHLNRARKNGLSARCKTCKKQYDNDRWTVDGLREKRKIEMRTRRLKGFGLTEEAYDSILAKQGSGCAICGAKEGWKGKRLAVDHDHETGAVRGLLCDRCNTAIGKFEDSPELLLRAVEYLR
jgi:hypothetical protein